MTIRVTIVESVCEKSARVLPEAFKTLFVTLVLPHVFTIAQSTCRRPAPSLPSVLGSRTGAVAARRGRLDGGHVVRHRLRLRERQRRGGKRHADREKQKEAPGTFSHHQSGLGGSI